MTVLFEVAAVVVGLGPISGAEVDGAKVVGPDALTRAVPRKFEGALTFSEADESETRLLRFVPCLKSKAGESSSLMGGCSLVRTAIASLCTCEVVPTNPWRRMNAIGHPGI